MPQGKACGMSSDYLATPGIEKDTAQRGGELFTLHPDSGWDVEQIRCSRSAEDLLPVTLPEAGDDTPV